MTFDFGNLLDCIKEYKTITIFRHEHPDCDAMGSQYGLYTWLRQNFPGKNIYALGNETCTQSKFPTSDSIPTKTIKESLAIVLDTANAERTDDQRFSQAKMVIKIDHHPNREPFGNMCVVFDTAAAACEILAQFFWDNSEVYSVSRETAEYLYKGLLTDTLCFRTTNTTSHTLSVASYLATKDIDIPALNRELFDTDLKIFQFGAYLRSHVVITDAGLAYCIVTKEELVKNAIRAGDARNCIDELGHVKQFKAWAVFTQHENGEEVYDASIRSKETAINTVAEKYGGGGHKNASGIKNIPADKLETLILDLKKEISK